MYLPPLGPRDFISSGSRSTVLETACPASNPPAKYSYSTGTRSTRRLLGLHEETEEDHEESEKGRKMDAKASSGVVRAANPHHNTEETAVNNLQPSLDDLDMHMAADPELSHCPRGSPPPRASSCCLSYTTTLAGRGGQHGVIPQLVSAEDPTLPLRATIATTTSSASTRPVTFDMNPAAESLPTAAAAACNGTETEVHISPRHSSLQLHSLPPPAQLFDLS